MARLHYPLSDNHFEKRCIYVCHEDIKETPKETKRITPLVTDNMQTRE